MVEISDKNKLEVLEFIEERIEELYKRKMMFFIGIYVLFFLFILSEFRILSIFIISTIISFLFIIFFKLSKKIKKLDFLWDCINYYF